MKSGTKNLLILGAVGLGALYLMPKIAKNTAQGAAEGAVSGGISGAADIVSGGLGAGYNLSTGFIEALLTPFVAGANLINQAVQTATGTITSTSGAFGRVGATTSSAPVAPSMANMAYLTQNTPQIQLAKAFNVPTSAINPAVNYSASRGYSASFSNVGRNISGKYNPSTGTLITPSGQGYSVPSYLVNRVSTPVRTAPAPVRTPITTPITRNPYFRV